MIQAKVIADSLSPQGNRLTTFIVTFPRIILAEFNTHRMFSRNSASSRAIPFEKMVKSVEENPFIPIAWQKHHTGMQGSEYYTEFNDIEDLEQEWLYARNVAISQAKILNDFGITKQICNRLLEPFMWHTVIVTATDFQNFFELRCPQYHLENVPVVNEDLSLNSKTITLLSKSKKNLLEQINEIDNDSYVSFKNVVNSYTELDWLKINKGQSEIHIQALAEDMWDAMNESIPKQLQADEWHIPFDDKLYNASNSFKLKVSTARCARVSYTVVGEEGKEHSYENDIKLHDKLLESGHFSPFEHCAKAMSDEEYQSYRKGKHEVTLMDNTENKYWFIEDESGELGWCNNFKGFIQYRYLIENGQS